MEWLKVLHFILSPGALDPIENHLKIYAFQCIQICMFDVIAAVEDSHHGGLIIPHFVIYNLVFWVYIIYIYIYIYIYIHALRVW